MGDIEILVGIEDEARDLSFVVEEFHVVEKDRSRGRRNDEIDEKCGRSGNRSGGVKRYNEKKSVIKRFRLEKMDDPEKKNYR